MEAAALVETWQATSARVQSIRKRLEREISSLLEDALTPLIKELLEIMDSDDTLVSFWALEVLRDAMRRVTDPSIAAVCIRLILHRPTSSGSCSRRLQLLHHLFKHAEEGEAEDTSKGDKAEEEEEVVDEDGMIVFDIVPCYLTNVLRNRAAFEVVLFTAMSDPQRTPHAAHEAIVCLTGVVKRSSEIEDCAKDGNLCAVVECTMELVVSWPFNSLPAYLACDIIDLAMASKEIYTHTSDRKAWVVMMITLLQSPLSTLALDRLNHPIPSDVACAESFIGIASYYPLLQKSIYTCCVTASSQLALCSGAVPIDWGAASTIDQLPSRTRLFAVLTEQDDIMVDVVIELLVIHRQLQTAIIPIHLKKYFDQEFHPDVVFAHVLQVFSDDHLVLLDMLMASETRMLEYLLQYLRQATASWPRCQIAWNNVNRTHSVMAALIRTRMEMERLVDADVFPYNAGPLIRRLETLEELYESHESHKCSSWS